MILDNENAGTPQGYDLLESVPEAIVIVDDEGRIVRVNAFFERLFNWTASELLGKPLEVLVPHDLAEKHRDLRAGFVQSPVLRRMGEGRCHTGIRRNGDAFPMQVSIGPFRHNGKLFITAVIYDATEQVRAEEELRRHGDTLEAMVAERTGELVKLSLAVENSPVSVVVTRRDGTIEYVNPRFTEVTGYSREEARGKNPRILKSGRQDPAFYKTMWDTILSGKTWRGVFENMRKNGETYLEEASISPIRDASGEITHIVAVKEEITERVRAEEELRRAKEAAEAATRAKSAFLANMSHEIRTPMNAVLGFTQLLLREQGLRGDRREYLEIILKSGEHLLNLINDVLEMSKIEAGNVPVKIDDCNLASLLGDLEQMFRIRADSKGLSFSVVREEGIPVTIRTDQQKIRQVLINLLANAVKFTQHGRVVLRAGCGGLDDGCLLIFEIEDTGPGIDGEEMKTLFHPFIQAAAGSRAMKGTGLGLAISKEYARLLGGDIIVQSVAGRGSVFRFEVPVLVGVCAPEKPVSGKRRVIGLLPGQRPFRILEVDDHPGNRLLVSRILSSVGFEVREAADGPAAIDLFTAWKPDLVFMDLYMPGMDGYEVIRGIRALPGGTETPIIALSAGVFHEDHPRGEAGGPEEYVYKPFKEDDLFNVINRFLGVSYLYGEQVRGGEGGAADITSVVQSITSSPLPAQIREELRAAVIVADIDRVNAILARLRADYPDAARRLADLAARYEYDKIIELIS